MASGSVLGNDKLKRVVVTTFDLALSGSVDSIYRHVFRRCFRNKDGKRHAYWALVESYRTDAGPRQRVVLGSGNLTKRGGWALNKRRVTRVHHTRKNQQPTTTSGEDQLSLFDQRDDQEPNDQPTVQLEWVEVNASGVRVENSRQFGGPWLALEVVRRPQLDEFLQRVMPRGRKHVSRWWSALILVVAGLCRPSSELYIAEQWYPKSVLPQLLNRLARLWVN